MEKRAINTIERIRSEMRRQGLLESLMTFSCLADEIISFYVMRGDERHLIELTFYTQSFYFEDMDVYTFLDIDKCRWACYQVWDDDGMSYYLDSNGKGYKR